MHELTVPKETPLPYEEMSAANVYNYPNPCNGHTAIRFSVPGPRKVDILINDITGRPVWQKHLDEYSVIAGVNYLLWDGINDRGVEAANGTYIFRVISGGKSSIQKDSNSKMKYDKGDGCRESKRGGKKKGAEGAG